MSQFQPVFERFAALVGSADIPGARVAIHTGGESHIWLGGFRDRGAGDALAPDGLYRLASLTKIVTSIVALTFVQEGRLDLTDPVTGYFPQLGRMKVGTEVTDPATGERSLRLDDAVRPITVHDLFRHTSGLTYGQFSESLVQQAYRAAGMSDHEQTREEILSKLADLPLNAQPGTTFGYGMSTDLLGWILEEIEGESLEAIFRRRLFEPCGMADAAFRPAAEAIGRIAQPQPDRDTGETPVLGSRNFYEAGWLSAGHGLFMSGPDMDRFAALLRGRGAIEGVRLISEPVFDWTTADHLPPNVGFSEDVVNLGAMAPVPEYGQGFGLGVLVRKERGRSPYPGTPGEFGWTGLSGTCLWVDPARDLSVSLLMQSPSNREQVRSLLRRLVYACL